jgi:hypothetical protein
MSTTEESDHTSLGGTEDDFDEEDEYGTIDRPRTPGNYESATSE